MKVLCVFLIASFVAFVTCEDTPLDWYHCTKVPDGKYEHPRDCLRYILCSNGEAYEKSCEKCEVDANCCPNGVKIFSGATQRCMWADETVCSIDNPDQVAVKGGKTSEIVNSDDEKPYEGESCNAQVCKIHGYCQSYLKCDKKTGTWVRDECGKFLVWNPMNANGTAHIHGGNCDFWFNLTPEVERQYRTDSECFWKARGDCAKQFEEQPDKSILRVD